MYTLERDTPMLKLELLTRGVLCSSEHGRRYSDRIQSYTTAGELFERFYPKPVVIYSLYRPDNMDHPLSTTLWGTFGVLQVGFCRGTKLRDLAKLYRFKYPDSDKLELNYNRMDDRTVLDLDTLVDTLEKDLRDGFMVRE